MTPLAHDPADQRIDWLAVPFAVGIALSTAAFWTGVALAIRALLRAG